MISGAAPLAPDLAAAVMNHFGEILYNGYASTESGSGTFATPRDLRAAPGTVGKPVAGTTIKILGDGAPGCRPRLCHGASLRSTGWYRVPPRAD